MSALKNAQQSLTKLLERKLDDDEQIENLLNTLSPTPQIPDAVYFCSIEPPSLSYQLPLDNALKQLQREDPSLRVKYDETTGQTVLGGMGELHLDIIKSRILTEYKIEADLGPLQIAYKECVDAETRDSLILEKEIAGSKQRVHIEMTLNKLNKKTKDIFCLDRSPEFYNNLLLIRPRQMGLVRKGVLSALERGPKLGGEVVQTQITLHTLNIGRGTADSFIVSTAYQCVQKILLKSGCKLLEPMMMVSIIVPTEKLSIVLGDLGKRRANILDINERGNNNKVYNSQ